MNWEIAACRGLATKLGYDIFFPTIIDDEGTEWIDDGTIYGAYGDTSEFYDQARKVCEVCPIKKECLATALANKERYGMWGGSTPIERRRVERADRRKKLRDKRAQETDDARID